MKISKEFLEKLFYHKINSHIDDTLDYVFNTLDELLYDGNYKSVDSILEKINIYLFSPEILVGILTITHFYKPFLKKRASFFKRIKKYYIENSIDVNKNLNGLK